MKLNVLGVGVNTIGLAATIDTIAGWIKRGERHYVCALNVHSVVESLSDPELRRIHNAAGLATPDGMPLVWLLRQAGFTGSERVCGRDLMNGVMRKGLETGYRHFLLGSTPETLSRLERHLLAAFPGVEIAGRLSPPFRRLTAEEDEKIVDAINRSGSQIVWVGLGAPKQERWMAAHLGRVDANVMIGVGAAFDFLAGTVREAPPLLQRCGLEWAFRLAMEPRRLWRRYLLTNTRFVARIFVETAGFRHFKVDA
jgi:N-acetylglucosaminyldiphosphoundecaprenol N-acetyl-beta-D-mannosaminyltransferase